MRTSPLKPRPCSVAHMLSVLCKARSTSCSRLLAYAAIAMTLVAVGLQAGVHQAAADVLRPTAEPGGSYKYQTHPHHVYLSYVTASRPGSAPTPTPSDGPMKLEVGGVAVSSHDGNGPENTRDSNFNTRWSAYGDGQWIQYDVGAIQTITALDIAFYRGLVQLEKFEIHVSADGTTWAPVFSGQSQPRPDNEFQRFDVLDTPARFVKIIGHGNTTTIDTLWNSLTEVVILGTTSAPTPTPGPPAPTPGPTTPPSEILWSADHEEGDMRDWWYPEPAGREGNNCGGEYNSEGGVSSATSALARTGGHGALLQTGNISSSQQGVRLFRWCEPRANDALYYSAWYLIPTRVTVESWWAIMQWKSAGSFNPKFWIRVGNRPDGEMYLYLGRGRDSGGGSWSQSIADIPVGEWFHLEAYYEKASDGTGRVTVWQDGVQILDLAGVSTANGEDLGWSVINYGDSLDPGNLTIYTDDAAISRTRLGP